MGPWPGVQRRQRLQVETGDAMILDGDTGEVRLEPSEEELFRAAERHRAWIAMEERVLAEASDLPAMTRDGVQVEVRANLEFTSELPTARRYGARC